MNDEKKVEDQDSFGKKLSVPVYIGIKKVITNLKKVEYMVESDIGNSPEVQLATANMWRSYCHRIAEKEKAAAKADKSYSKKELNDVLSTIAFLDMVISTQAPILYRDLKAETVKMKQEQDAKKGEGSKLVLINKMGGIQ